MPVPHEIVEVGDLCGRLDTVGGLLERDPDLSQPPFETRLQYLRGEVGDPFRFGEELFPLLACPFRDRVDALDVLGQRHLATATSPKQQRDTQRQWNESLDGHQPTIKQCPIFAPNC